MPPQRGVRRTSAAQMGLEKRCAPATGCGKEEMCAPNGTDEMCPPKRDWGGGVPHQREWRGAVPLKGWGDDMNSPNERDGRKCAPQIRCEKQICPLNGGRCPPAPPSRQRGRPPHSGPPPRGSLPYVPPSLGGGRHRPTPPAARRGRSPHLIVHGWAQQRRGPRSLAPAAAAVSLPGRRGGGGERISSPALSTSEAAPSVPPTPLPTASAAACSVAAPHGPAARLIVCHSQAAPAPRPPRGTGNRLSATAAPARRQCPRAARRGAGPRDGQADRPMSGGRAAGWAGPWAGPALRERRRRERAPAAAPAPCEAMRPPLLSGRCPAAFPGSVPPGCSS